MGGITRITIHHSGEARFVAPASISAAANRMRSYQSSHQARWADIGYHFVIDTQGRIWEGRELRWQGAHAGNAQANAHNVGIAVMGNFQHTRPNRAQLMSLERLIVELSRRYHISPLHIYTHNEVRRLHRLGGTACPGRYLQGDVIQLRQRLVARADAS